MRGKRREKQAECFDQEGYDGYRPKVETVFSVEKRKRGSVVLVFRALAYNRMRVETLSLLLIEVFYTA